MAEAQICVATVKYLMAVFLGTGKDGWKSVVRDGDIDSATRKLLAERYVCVYVDTQTAAAKRVAEQFDVASHGLIISDRTGASQAYSLSGKLSKAELTQTLGKYADPGREIRTTETVVREFPAGTASGCSAISVVAGLPDRRFRSGPNCNR